MGSVRCSRGAGTEKQLKSIFTGDRCAVVRDDRHHSDDRSETMTARAFQPRTRLRSRSLPWQRCGLVVLLGVATRPDRHRERSRPVQPRNTSDYQFYKIMAAAKTSNNRLTVHSPPVRTRSVGV